MNKSKLTLCVLFCTYIFVISCTKNEDLVNEDYTIVLTDGNNQTEPINRELPERVKVKVTDNNGNAISDIAVKYTKDEMSGNGTNNYITVSSTSISNFSWSAIKVSD